MTAYSQRDWKWRWKRLGSSILSIGGYGCTLTCLSMVTDIPVNVANDKLVSSGGFTVGDAKVGASLINWTKLQALGLTFVSRLQTYDNAVVLQAITDHGFCLVMVDAAPIGNPGGTHWVLFTGNHLLADPWTGTICPTSKYQKLLGFVVLKKNY